MCSHKPVSKTSLKQFSHKIHPGLISDVPYLEFHNLSKQTGLIHGVFTRKGGISAPPYDSLNSAYDIGDPPENVEKNLELIGNVLNIPRLIFMKQVHGSDIVTMKKNHEQELKTTPEADVIVTDIPCLALMVKQADCQGVILFDPFKRVVSIVHCGWKGNTINTLGKTVAHMVSVFGCVKSHILAAIGPSLGPCCAEFISYREIFPREFTRFKVRDNHFDLWKISRQQLIKAGLKEENIDISGICTKCNTDLFFSYRGEGVTGRFATVAMLTQVN